MSDTIAAIATAMNTAGIGIVRISGDQSIELASRICRSKTGRKPLILRESHTIHYGFVYDEEEIIDEVLVMVMRAPRSYTGEDTVEIDCHGGIYALNRVLETVLKAGVRIADPGEFTKRAFLNGRIDLSQAEAVMDVIQAQNTYALQNSVQQLKGSVAEKIQILRKEILHHMAFLESALDDPEHFSLDGYPETLRADVQRQIEQITGLIDSFSDGRILREGIQTVILGKPNAGKSSLLNLLAGKEKAIVTEIAGTTRDLLEEYINLGNLTLHMIDTAGIRNTENLIEKIGVEKTKQIAAEADLIIYLVDSSTPLDQNDVDIMGILQDKKVIVLLNKSDLEPVITVDDLKKSVVDYVYHERMNSEIPILPVSVKENTGIDALIEKIQELFFHGKISYNDEIYISNARHKFLLEEARNSLTYVISSIDQQIPEDFYSIDLMNAYQELGSIIGEEVGEDLIDEIFSEFCIGK